jgi:catalase (peroxidase I)
MNERERMDPGSYLCLAGGSHPLGKTVQMGQRKNSTEDCPLGPSLERGYSWDSKGEQGILEGQGVCTRWQSSKQ